MLVSLEIRFFGTPFSRMFRRIRCHCFASRYMPSSCENFRLSSCHYFGELGSIPREFMAICSFDGRSKKTRHCLCVRRESACDAHQLASAFIPSDAPGMPRQTVHSTHGWALLRARPSPANDPPIIAAQKFGRRDRLVIDPITTTAWKIPSKSKGSARTPMSCLCHLSRRAPWTHRTRRDVACAL